MSDRSTRDRKSATGLPGWVKLLGVAAIAVLVLFLALHFSGLMPMGHSM